MASDEEEQNPYTQPGFISASVVIAGIVILGLVLAINALTGKAPAANGASTTPRPTQTAAPPSIPTPNASSSNQPSICGLPEDSTRATTVEAAPRAAWRYQGTLPYPYAATYGPGATRGAVRYCFQHSPTGALFAAANAVSQGSDPQTLRPWLEYFVASGPDHNATVAGGLNSNADDGNDSGGGGSSTDPNDPSEGTRIRIAGYRVLFYDGRVATVDIALQGEGGGQSLLASAVYTLVWQAGDWKLQADDPSHPIDIAQINDLSGYTPWGD